MFNFSEYEIKAYRVPVDLRKSFDGLLGVISKEVGSNPLSKTLFLFFNRRQNYLKLLFWDRTGYCLICKKLEVGSFSLPDGKLDLDKLKLIFDGIKLGKRRRK